MSFAELWPPAAEPPTKLGRHRRLSSLAGVHVSPICLGGMSIGDKWGPYGFGAMDKESSFKLLDAFYAAGGNFIDTANNYQDETSEAFLGEWMESRGVREHMVIATKVGIGTRIRVHRFTTLWLTCGGTVLDELQARADGHQAADVLHGQQHEVAPQLGRGLAQEAPDRPHRHPLRPLGEPLPSFSLLQLSDDRSDQWDYQTSVEEVMNGLHALVMAGKVLYLVRPFLPPRHS